MKVVSTKLGNEEWDKFVDRCNTSGCTKAEYLRDIILREIGKKSDTSEEPKKMGLAEFLLTISSKKQNEVTIDGKKYEN